MLTLGLIVIGLLLLWRIGPHLSDSPRAVGSMLALVAGGLMLNIVSTLKRQLAVRPVVRVSGCVIAVALLVTLLALRHHIATSVLPAVPREDATLRAAMATWQAQLLWLAVAVAYVVASVALLPPRATAGPVTAHGSRQGRGVTVQARALRQSDSRSQLR